MLEIIPYLLLRYGRLKIHLYPLSSFWGVAQDFVMYVSSFRQGIMTDITGILVGIVP